MISNSSSNPTKKRKGNEGNAIATDGRSGSFFSSWFGYFSGRDACAAPSTQCKDAKNNNTSSQLDRMEEMMIKMAEKCSSLEKALETKCSSLENALDIKLQSVKDQVDKLEDNVNSLRSDVKSIHVHAQQNHEYNQMILRNQGWTYPVVISTYDDWMFKGYSDHQAYYLEDAAAEMKNMTNAMRRGKFSETHTSTSQKIVSVCPDTESASTHSNNELRPHWDEFAAALRQFAPAIKMVPDDVDSSFHLGDYPMDQKITAMIKRALIGKPFTNMCFEHYTGVDYEVGGMNIDAIIKIAESNKSLRKLEIYSNRIGSDHVQGLCSIAHNHPLQELILDNSIDDDGVGDAMLTSLLSSQELKLEKLSMRNTRVTSEISTLLANFIATNPMLKELNLADNDFNDNDAALMANALRSNTTLRQLCIGNDDLTRDCVDVFKSVVYDTRSLNAIASSNHQCNVSTYCGNLYRINSFEKIEENRGCKIYSLLSDNHVEEHLSNVQCFSDIDAKLLPKMLEAIQKYGNASAMASSRIIAYPPGKRIKSLSIVYEVMRKWEKVFNLYESA